MIVKVEVREQCRKCFHFQVCASVLKNDLYIREVLCGEKEPKCEAFVEVVRCKDCKYGEYDYTEYFDYYVCRYVGGDWNKGDHFCSYGERRNDV